jgi:hypothetical protein
MSVKLRIIHILSLLLLASPGCKKETTFVAPTLDTRMFGNWNFIGFQDPNDTLVTLHPGESINLTITSDGRFSGIADCNNYGGYFYFEPDGLIQVNRFFVTADGCFPLVSLDGYIQGWDSAKTVEVAEDSLYIIYGTQNSKLVFTRE